MRAFIQLFAAVSFLAGCPGTPEGDACLTCHEGIEPIHGDELPAGTCVLCHGGDPEAKRIEDAHVAVPANWAEIAGDGAALAPWGYIRDFTPDQLDALDPAYLRFVNPADIRVNADTCGGCHPVQVATQRNSVMTTNSGHYMPTRFLAGFQDRDAVYGSYGASDPNYTGEPGTVEAVQTLVPPDSSAAEGDEETAYDHYLAKSCNHCHAASYGKNNSRGLYRSSGCAACHVPYDMDGVYKGNDPAIPKNVPVHAARHEITRAVPTEQCASCHFQGGRIGLLFRGIREGGFSDTPEHAEPWSEAVYGHVAGYYILDEDTTNDVDETPPDAHYAAGMHCVDCHVGSDVHGDGRIYTTSKGQVDIACEDCHGTVREAAQPGEDGVFRTSGRGRPLRQLSARDGAVVLTTLVGGEQLEVPQPARMLSEGTATTQMRACMGENDEGWSHTDGVSCTACHSGYQQFCLGCHVTVDYRLSQKDYQTGETSAGLVRGSRSWYALDQLLLSKGTDGKAWPTNPSQQVQMTIIGRDGATLMDKQFRQTPASDANLGFSPFFQHTTTRHGRTCTQCHRADDSAAELARVRGVFGHGTGEFLLESGDGQVVDALQFLDDAGNPLTEWVHPGTGPLDPDVRQRALSVVLDAQ